MITNIAWPDWSLNFIKWFCTPASEGCKNCYMFAMAKRWPANAADHPALRPQAFKELKKIPAGAFVFVGDMYDTYHEQMPLAWIHSVHNIATYIRPDLTFLLLTKRVERVHGLAPYLSWPDNLWLGITVENHRNTQRIDLLRQIPASKKFISFEPLLQSVKEVDLTGIDWAIVGAESGNNRRPFNKQWAREIQAQCKISDTAFFYKQSSGNKPGTDPYLDGRKWQEFPPGHRPLKHVATNYRLLGDKFQRGTSILEIVFLSADGGYLVKMNNSETPFPVTDDEITAWIAGKPSPIPDPAKTPITKNKTDAVGAHRDAPNASPNETPKTLPINQIINMDSLEYLQSLPANSIHTMITSPPYWGLRDYGVDGQVGMEETLQEFITKLVTIFHEARRILRDDGTLWVNMGDSYAGTHNGYSGDDRLSNSNGSISSQNAQRTVQQKNTVGDGLKPKDLIGQPWRLALALQDDGWYLRSDIIWNKTNCMPESVNDRPTKSHEYVFLLAKSQKYYYDREAIAEPVKTSSLERPNRAVSNDHKNLDAKGLPPGNSTHSLHKARANGDSYDMPATKNKRTVWTIPAKGFADAHFATFPEDLIEPMILAGCPPVVCKQCGSPHTRIIETVFVPQEDVSIERGIKGAPGQKPQYEDNQWDGVPRGSNRTKTTGWQPTCKCAAGTEPGRVLDMFMGSGTTGLVAMKNGRNYLGCDLNADYVKMAQDRLAQPIEVDMFTSAAIPTNCSVPEQSTAKEELCQQSLL